jgi:hypothetical protein
MSNYGSIPIFDPPILSDFPATNVVYVSQFSGEDKPRPYPFGETSFVVAGFIPACKGQNVEKIAQFRTQYSSRLQASYPKILQCPPV